ncbi:MAG: hypothetical protein QOJ76_385 [Acidobacteriota bacterium]|jgi:hypothetical protein|nr:hypothetical protein [Acidobacteriota bacterium]
MQILIQVISSGKQSLRDAIINDPKLDGYNLKVSEYMRPHRSHGWSKLHSTLPDRHGAINIQWDGASMILLCRVVTRGSGKPNLIIGDFVDYLLARFKRRIQAVNILPR